MEKYFSLEKKELESRKKVNEIFLGISLGMRDTDFFSHCWDMNQKGLFEGTSDVTYRLNKHEMRHPAEMIFFPEFKNGRIDKMRARFQYANWSAWNKELAADSLLPDVLQLYKKWYPQGNPFIALSNKDRKTIYVKVDGNRRIIIGKYDDSNVKVDYTDLSAEPK